MTAVISWFDSNLINVLNGLAVGLLLFTIAVGLSLIFGLMDVLNLAHGALYLVGAYLAYLVVRGGGGFVWAALLAIVVGLVGGAALMGMTRRWPDAVTSTRPCSPWGWRSSWSRSYTSSSATTCSVSQPRKRYPAA